MNSSQEITRLLVEWSSGNQEALEQLMPLVYDELHRIAKRHFNQQSGHTLQTTALVHEAYLKLEGLEDKRWQNRSHFFAVAARAMRHVLIDYLRSKQTEKRGGDLHRVSLDEALIVSDERADALIALDDALEKLEKHDQRKCRVVELRYFAGLSVKETADMIQTSEITVMRDWDFAKNWLQKEISGQMNDVT